MPNNINHVVVGNETKLDLREDTVTPSTMVNGIVAHDASGVRIVGTFDPSIYVLKTGDIMSGNLETPKVYHSEGTANNAYSYSLDKDGLTIEGNHISGDTYDKVFVEDTRIKLASGLYDADRDTNRLILNPSSINMYEYGDSTSIIRDKVEISKDRIKIHNYSGGDTSIGSSELTVGNKDVLRTHRSLVGGYGTEITANKDLNTNEFLKVGRYYCRQNVTVATLTNCPTSNAFMMDVFTPISSSFDDESSGGSRYRVRVLMHFYGGIYVQYAYASSSSGSTWTYGSWMMITTATTGEENSAYWMKAQGYRPSSLDNLTRTYANSRVHMRLDIVSSSVSNSPFDGDGYLLTFFWDSDGLWDTQVFFPNGGGTPAIRKRRNNTTWETAIKLCTNTVTKSTITTLAAGTPYANFGGCFYELSNNLMHIHLGISGLAINTSQSIFGISNTSWRPKTVITGFGLAGGHSVTNVSNARIETDGTVAVCSSDGFARIDLWYYI